MKNSNYDFPTNLTNGKPCCETTVPKRVPNCERTIQNTKVKQHPACPVLGRMFSKNKLTLLLSRGCHTLAVKISGSKRSLIGCEKNPAQVVEMEIVEKWWGWKIISTGTPLIWSPSEQLTVGPLSVFC